MLSLKPMSVTWSRLGTAPRNALTAIFSRGIAGAMLPLTSTATMSSSGTSSEPKCEIFCALPSSSILKADRGSPATKWPVLSVTVAMTWTTSTSTFSA